MGEYALLGILVASIALIVVLIAICRVHAFLSLSVAGVFVAVASGMPLNEIGQVMERGVGGTLGFLTIIIGCGAILGKMLEVSGGAKRIALSMLDCLGEKRANIAMLLVGFFAGIPVFVEVGFILLAPLVLVVAKELKVSRIKIGVALATSLMCVHCMIPPHPAATAIVATLKADIAYVILMGIGVGVVAAFAGGVLWVNALKPEREVLEDMDTTQTQEELPSTASTFLVILLPLILMLLKVVPTQSALISFISNPIIALLVSVFVTYILFRDKISWQTMSEETSRSFLSIGGILLIIGAGGAFNEILLSSGIGDAIKSILSSLSLNPVFLAWFIAIVLHVAVGSATVAMISAASIVLPLVEGGGISREVLCLAIGSGAIGLTIVTDSLFWLVKESLGMSVKQMFKYFTTATTIASVVGLLLSFGLSYVL